MKASIFRKPAFISHVISHLHDLDVNKQIGKTVIQKIMYLLSREGIGEFSFSMYHYGPYSGQVESELRFAETSGMVAINWQQEQGYFITPSDELRDWSGFVTEDLPSPF